MKTRIKQVSEGIVQSEPRARALKKEDHKKRARKAQEGDDFAYLVQPILTKYFSNVQNLLGKKPAVLDEKIAVLKFLGLEDVSQLDNSYTISQHVKTLLSEEKVPQAIHLCRMAKSAGSVGMNQVLQHLVQHKDHNTAVQVFNNMRKWGCAPTDRTSVIINKYLATSTKALTTVEVQRLLQSYEHSLRKTRSGSAKTILSNALLETLARRSSVNYAFAMYKDIPDSGSFSKDCRTYTTMLNMISNQPQPLTQSIISKRKQIWQEVEKRESEGTLVVDARLADAYCNALAGQTSTEYFDMIMEVQEKYFSKDGKNADKFSYTARQLGILLQSAENTGQHKAAVDTFTELQKSGTVKLDLANYHDVMRIASTMKHSQELLRTLFEGMLADYAAGNEAAKPTAVTFHLMWSSFLKDVHKKIDLENLEHTVQHTLPKLEIPITDMILSSYIKFYQKVFARSYGKGSSSSAGLRAIQFMQEHIESISDVSPEQKNPARLNKILVNSIRVCDFALNHTDQKLSETDIEYLNNAKTKFQELLATLKQNFDKKPEATPEKSKEKKEASKEKSTKDKKPRADKKKTSSSHEKKGSARDGKSGRATKREA